MNDIIIVYSLIRSVSSSLPVPLSLVLPPSHPAFQTPPPPPSISPPPPSPPYLSILPPSSLSISPRLSLSLRLSLQPTPPSSSVLLSLRLLHSDHIIPTPAHRLLSPLTVHMTQRKLHFETWESPRLSRANKATATDDLWVASSDGPLADSPNFPAGQPGCEGLTVAARQPQVDEKVERAVDSC